MVCTAGNGADSMSLGIEQRLLILQVFEGGKLVGKKHLLILLEVLDL